jgi:outer membrane PBP1 activator LpoA protein
MNRSLLVSMLLRGLLLLAASVACAVHAQTPTPASTAIRSTVPAVADRAGRPTILLLLPAQSTAFALPAEALREGFFAAHKVSGDDIAIQVVELDDSADQLGVALASARDRGVGIVVGPLPRTAVTDVVEGQRASLPLLALNFPESDGAAPTTMLAMALSVEYEAQRIARLALSEFVGVRTADTRPRIAVVTRPGGIERRIAQAYVSALRSQGEVPQLVEWTPATAAKVAAQLATPTLEAVFLALTARDAAQLRALIPRQAQIFGTSLLYIGDPRTSPDAATLAYDLEGVRFVDMPWLLEPDHAGVMVYPAPANPLPTELVRLYALGIDAYRLAAVWMKGERRFDLDGVTGRLQVDRAKSLRVERTPVLAIYRGGAVQRIDVAR